MDNIFKEFQDLLCELEPDYILHYRRLHIRQQSLSGKDLICSNMIIRFCIAMANREETQTGSADILGLLRQIIRAYERRVSIKVSLWQTLSDYGANFGLRAIEMPASTMIELMADVWQPTWLEKTDNIDELSPRRFDEPAIGDGLLYAMSEGRFSSYQSEAQKVAVQECLFAPPGATLLITLPTGAGKSMCIQLPAWQESQGGTIKGGTTLVIVPTVSLAMDQEQRVQGYFSHAYGLDFKPCSLTGATPDNVRIAIYKGLQQGTLPILYTSPEALMNSSLYHICLEAAQRGTINRLIIDEAHLIETWGAGFRTEFQFLAAYQKKLLAESQGRLRTILLSATVTDNCEKLLKQLFSSSNKTFYSIRADRLRPEIAYWFNTNLTSAMRQEHVIEALRYLPRPAIVYVTSPDYSKNWLQLLKGQGFKRIAEFSGDTKTDDRLRLIKEWNNNECDIMVATSAFGVGVDKSDIRTIIHASLPENIDRFYQEVGRGGRDGFSSISLMCLTHEDLIDARSMNRTARITTAKAISRWEGMYKERKMHPERNDIVLVNTNAPPSEKQEMYQGRSNKEWNEHTLLLMQRAGLINITDARDEVTLIETESHEELDNITENKPVWLQVELTHPHITSYPHNETFFTIFDTRRKQEVEQIQKTLSETQNMVLDYTTTKAKRCIAHRFTSIYTQSTPACGGCPTCRQHKLLPYISGLEIEREGGKFHTSQQEIPMEMQEIMGVRKHIQVILDEPCTVYTLLAMQPVLIQLVKIGFQQIILPDELTNDKVWIKALISELVGSTQKPHILLDEQWITSNKMRPVYTTPTVMFYPLQNQRADEVHQAFQRYKKSQLATVPILLVARRRLFLASENGTFVERINGLAYNIERLQDKLKDPLDLFF